MRLIRNLTVVIFAAIMLAACGGGSPESVAESYVKAALTIDFKAAAKYSSKEHAADILEAMDYMEEEAEELAEAKEGFVGITYKITEVDVEGDEATVKFEFAKGDETSNGRLELIKEDGSWKVDEERLRLYF